MTNDVKVVIGFVILVILLCRAWSYFGIKQYKKNKVFQIRKEESAMIRNVELDFVSEGKLKYPGVNSKLFSSNVRVETEDEARNRLLQRIYEGNE